jgi:hypothetical protein
VVTAEVPWLDSLLPEEPDSLEDPCPLEDVLVDVSALVVGVLELVELSVALEVPDDPVPDDSVVEPLAELVFSAAAFFAAARAAAALRSAAVLAAEALAVCELDVLAVFVVERAGSCPEASWTYTARNAALNSAAATPATERRMRRTRRRIAARRLLASERASGGSGEGRRGCFGEGVWGSIVTPVAGSNSCNAVSVLRVRIHWSDAERILSGNRRALSGRTPTADRPLSRKDLLLGDADRDRRADAGCFEHQLVGTICDYDGNIVHAEYLGSDRFAVAVSRARVLVDVGRVAHA